MPRDSAAPHTQYSPFLTSTQELEFLQSGISLRFLNRYVAQSLRHHRYRCVLQGAAVIFDGAMSTAPEVDRVLRDAQA